MWFPCWVNQKNMSSMDLKIKKEIIADNVLALSIFFLPLFQIVSIICWGILILTVVIQKDYKNIFQKIRSFPLLLLFILLYLFYLTGMLWTEDRKEGWEDLVIKLPLLIFPILFSTVKFSSDSFRKAGIALVAGCVLAIAIGLVHSYSLYLDSNDVQKFFYISFSVFLHPTYFTMYLNLALLFISYDTLNDNKSSFHSGKVRITLFFLLIIGVILLTARLAMLITFFTLIVFILAESFKRKKIRIFIPRFLIQAVLIIGIFIFLIRLDNRFVQISEAIQNHKDTTAVFDSTTQVYYNSTTIRLGLFKNSVNVFKNNFLTGVGTGDVIHESVKQLDRSHLNYLAKRFTGAHNQYLQTAMSLGIFGLLLLVFCIIFPLKDYLKSKYYLGICFIIIVFLNALGDTVLRASSLYFFSFFGCFIYVNFKKYYHK